MTLLASEDGDAGAARILVMAQLTDHPVQPTAPEERLSIIAVQTAPQDDVFPDVAVLLDRQVVWVTLQVPERLSLDIFGLELAGRQTGKSNIGWKFIVVVLDFYDFL